LGSCREVRCDLLALLTAAVASSPLCYSRSLAFFFLNSFVYSLSCCLLAGEILGGLGFVTSCCLDRRFWFFSRFWFLCEMDYFYSVCFLLVRMMPSDHPASDLPKEGRWGFLGFTPEGRERFAEFVESSQ